ncbi:MAG: type II secretion system protein [Candidatus Saganbacteria bacterium]|nr:type II secretion system protein [Candidatus Saganbacteria bacterium]
MKRNRKGFTLIELIMVIVILGVLSAMLLPRFGTIQDKAKDAAFKGVVGSVRAGIATYRAQQLANGIPTANSIPSSLEVASGAIAYNASKSLFECVMEPGYAITSNDWRRSAYVAKVATYYYCPGGSGQTWSTAVATYDGNTGSFTSGLQ